MLIVLNKQGQGEAMSVIEFRTFIRQTFTKVPVLQRIDDKRNKAGAVTEFLFSIQGSDYALRCTRNQLKALLKSGIVSSNEFKLTKNARLLRRPVVNETEGLQKQISAYYNRLETICKACRIPFRRDVIRVDTQRNGVYLYEAHSIVQGVYCIPPFVTHVREPLDKGDSIFSPALKRLKVVNKSTKLTDISGLFKNCSSLEVLDLSEFDTHCITDMQSLFRNCVQLRRLDLSAWDVSAVRNMSGMFLCCEKLQEIKGISDWNVSNVTFVSSMFSQCRSLSGLDLSKWPLSQACVGVESIPQHYFVDCSVENLPKKLCVENEIKQYYRKIEQRYKVLGIPFVQDELQIEANGDVLLKKVNTVVNGIYYIPPFVTGTVDTDEAIFDEGIQELKVINKGTKLRSAAFLFRGCKSLRNLDLSEFDICELTDTRFMFYYCTALQCLDVSAWDMSKVTDMYGMFSCCDSLEYLDVSAWNVSNVINMQGMFSDCDSLKRLDVSAWDVANVLNMSGMFYNCKSLQVLDVARWDVSNVADMNFMFSGCISLTTLNVSAWNVSNVVDMACLFADCCKLTALDVSNWDVSNVTSMRYMFANCTCLKSIPVENWVLFKVTEMQSMFKHCISLTEIPVHKWDVSRVQNMNSLFSECVALKTIPLSDWDVRSVVDMVCMFDACKALEHLDLSRWNMSNVATVMYMFKHCTALKELGISGWSVSDSLCVTDMFLGCNQAIIPEWYINKVK